MNQDGGWGLQGTRAKLKVSTFPSLSILLVLLKERVAQEAGGVGGAGDKSKFFRDKSKRGKINLVSPFLLFFMRL